MTILDTIIADKQSDLQALPNEIALTRTRPVLPFHENIRKANTLCIISEIKRASPSKGDIKIDVEPIEQAQAYQAGGADAISILTEQHHFKGSMNELKLVKENVNVPVLNKDFITDKRQIIEAFNHGADIILLIVAILTDAQLRDYYDFASSLNLNVLVEVHDEAEMIRALNIQPQIIGINNRNLKTFNVDIAQTEKLLAHYYQDDIIFVAESGIKTPEDAKRMQKAGASVLLVGEAIMQSDNPSETLRSLKVKRDG